MYTVSSVYILFHIIHFMQKAFTLYLQFCCTDPDWDVATTEQTDIISFTLLYIYIIIRWYISNQFGYLLHKTTFFN